MTPDQFREEGKKIIVITSYSIHYTKLYDIDKNAVAIIKPSIMFLTLVPTTFIMVKAIRLCKFHFSIEMAKIKPPT